MHILYKCAAKKQMPFNASFTSATNIFTRSKLSITTWSTVDASNITTTTSCTPQNHHDDENCNNPEPSPHPHLNVSAVKHDTAPQQHSACNHECPVFSGNGNQGKENKIKYI